MSNDMKEHFGRRAQTERKKKKEKLKRSVCAGAITYEKRHDHMCEQYVCVYISWMCSCYAYLLSFRFPKGATEEKKKKNRMVTLSEWQQFKKKNMQSIHSMT